MVTLEQINQWFTQSVQMEIVVQSIIAIGNESLNLSEENGSCKKVAEKQPDDNEMYEFHKIDTKTGEWVADPRIVRIGQFLHQRGGINLMQGIFYEVNQRYGGSMRGLEFAWSGIGEWMA